MTGRIQIPVQKQGSFDETNWSDRTLTIDVPTETATVSRHDHPDDLYHHSIRLLGIQKWADMPSTSSGHGHNSAEAKMTLHLMGVKVPAMHYDTTEEAHSNGGSHGAHEGEQHQHRPAMQHQPGVLGSEVDSSWMVRCITQEDYDAAVALLEKIVHASQLREAAHHAHKEHAAKGPLVPGPVAGESYQSINASPVL